MLYAGAAAIAAAPFAPGAAGWAGRAIFTALPKTTLFLGNMGMAELGYTGVGLGAAGTAGNALVPKATAALGQWGEARLAQVLGGAGYKPANALMTSLGRRFVDRLVDGVAHEAKAGVNVGLNSTVRTQIAKDVELMSANDIKGAHWHFFQGAEPELLEHLEANGIKATVH